MNEDDIIEHSESVIAVVDEDGEVRKVGVTSGFRVSPSCEFVTAETASIDHAAFVAQRAIRTREGKWRALIATLPSIHVNTLGDSFEPETEDDFEYKTEFPLRIYLQKVDD